MDSNSIHKSGDARLSYKWFALKAVLALFLSTVVVGCSEETPPTTSKESPPPPALPLNLTCNAPPRPAASIALEEAFPNLTFNLPVAMLQAPGDSNRWYVAERGGRIWWFDNNDSVEAPTLFIDLTDQVDSRPISEGGLLGMAFHPDFFNNGYIFLFYMTSDDPVGDWDGENIRSRISRFSASADRNALLASSEVEIMTVPQSCPFHKGGNIAFGPDGYLYIGLGDDCSGLRIQNVDELPGKILRIDIDSDTPRGPYTIPPDNPFAESGGQPEIYAWGFRNPWRWSFDRETGELWLGDVGQSNWEEINKVVRGGNYGWLHREGAHCFSPETGCLTEGLIDPIGEYDHTVGCSITGGYVYRGEAIPNLQGSFVFGDFCSGEISHVGNSGGTVQSLATSGLSITTFGEGSDGEIYAVGYFEGRIRRLVAGTIASNTFPQRLSETGCVDPANPSQPAAGLIAYGINVPFWSDGATKSRFIALPPNEKITIGTDHDWTFPVGTVLMKHFILAGRLLETRLFMRHPDGEWGGYSYEWDIDQTDAMLVINGKDKPVGGSQTWRFPTGAECLRCHTAAAGRALGPETSQMNRMFAHPTTGKLENQLSSYEQLGLFNTPLPDVPQKLPALPAADNLSESIELRARAFLHANCSNCHRPGGPTPVGLDLRYDTPLDQTNVCNVVPQEGDLGVAEARLLLPGEPERSIIPLRMRALDANRMPPLASSVIDSDGVILVESWIRSLLDCP